MKFKVLNEEFTSNDLYKQVENYIYDKLESTVDNLAIQVSSDIKDYDADYCGNETSSRAYAYLSNAATAFADELLRYAPEVIHEGVNDFYKNEPSDDFDASAFIGKPLKDFLRTIDHRTKINISSEEGFDADGSKGNTSGMSGLAHDVSWYLADKLINDIKVPQDKRFYDYSIFIE